MTGIYLIDIEYNGCVFVVCTLNVGNLNICPPWKLIIKICQRTPQPYYPTLRIQPPPYNITAVAL